MSDGLHALADRLDACTGHLSGLSVVAGFDGFVDEVIEVLATRTSPEKYRAMGTIREFGHWANASAGRSGLRECVVRERLAGGCTVNLGDGIATLGFPLDVFAGLGDPPDEVFAAFCGKCRSVETLGMDPGRSLVLEFGDGKLMLCSISHFAGFTPRYLSGVMTDGVYRSACGRASGVVLTSWSVYPRMTECWKFLQREVLAGIGNRPRILLDLADPASRDAVDIVGMVETLAGFEDIGPTTLSLNGNEAERLARALGIRGAGSDPLQVARLAESLRERAGIDEVGVHLVEGAAGACGTGGVFVEGPLCEKPQRSVGGGDRFNAGWLAGYLLGLEQRDRLLLAAATSGYFVRTGCSGTIEEIAEFLRCWAGGWRE